jgi:hypothetical protein
MTLMTKLGLSSPAFANDGAIPRHHTCDGDDVSPPLSWGPAPAGTRSWVLVVEDLDARNWVHWLVVNLPPEVTSLDEGASNHLPEGAVSGRTDFGPALWGGPCPSSGEHRYRFTISALSQPIELGPEVTVPTIRTAMYGHVLEEATLTGIYRRN